MKDKQIVRVLDELKNGPATSMEIAAETELPRKHACSILRSIWAQGLATRKLLDKTDDGPGRRGYLYTLKTLKEQS